MKLRTSTLPSVVSLTMMSSMNIGAAAANVSSLVEKEDVFVNYVLLERSYLKVKGQQFREHLSEKIAGLVPALMFTKKEKHMKNIKPLQLIEVAWEITPECNKKCDYCGSKELRDKPMLSNEKIISIARNISSAQKELGNFIVCLTGGEPGTLDRKLLNSVVDELKSVGLDVTAVTNGNLFEMPKNVLSKFTSIGISVNYADDITVEKLNEAKKRTNDVVVITNFGKHNYWEFEKIKSIICKSNNPFNKETIWQIQLTMGEQLLPQEAIGDLWNKIEQTNQELKGSVNVVLADNLQYSHECTAGVHTCGITYDGQLTPCLFSRAFCGAVVHEGSLLTHRFANLWMTGFTAIRFTGEFKSCRDCFILPKRCVNNVDEQKNLDYLKQWTMPNTQQPIVVAYMVATDYTIRGFKDDVTYHKVDVNK